ncbi:3487_t:CDS:1, partial [Gigaspora margarita]
MRKTNFKESVKPSRGYFLEGNVNKNERHTAKSMLTQLKQCVENGVIEKDEVPKLETIQNWIA